MTLDPLVLSRIQFGFTVSFHIIFPAFTIGLAAWLATMEGMRLATGNPVYRRLFDFWIKIFAVSFGMGVVSGIVMAFQFGTNWSVLAEKTGPIQGPLLGYETFTAFLLEATFLGVMLVGRDRVLTLAASFWPYMIPYSVTVKDAAAPPQSLKFFFWGGGLVVFPIVLIYTLPSSGSFVARWERLRMAMLLDAKAPHPGPLPASGAREGSDLTADMVWLPGGTFRMGSDRHYPEEAPVHSVTVSPFRIDRTPVTNRQFREFVQATGYVTVAEIVPDPKDYPGALPNMLRAGSLVFNPPKHQVDLRDWSQWWTFKFGANWRRPYGPRSSLAGLNDHPVVHVAYKDAEAYAAWAGKELPTEAEWEYAARGGLDGAEFAWGEEFTPVGRHMANTWQGDFPHENLATDGYKRTSPVGAFPANGHGLFDMIGNVWEWTTDWYSTRHTADAPKACCVPENPRGGPEADSYGQCSPSVRIPRKVVKGGSFLCAPNYCRRYRPAARHAQPIDTGMSHVGFRCVVRLRRA